MADEVHDGALIRIRAIETRGAWHAEIIVWMKGHDRNAPGTQLPYRQVLPTEASLMVGALRYAKRWVDRHAKRGL